MNKLIIGCVVISAITSWKVGASIFIALFIPVLCWTYKKDEWREDDD